MSAILQDTRHALRQLSRHPGFIFTAVLTLAVGIGVNAVAFTVVNGILFKGPATTVGQGIGRIATIPGGDENGYASLDEYQRFSSATSGALDLAAEGRLSMALQQDTITRTVWVLFVSRNYFSIVQAAPIAGRIDVSRPPGAVPSVVIGERFWRTTLQSGSIAGLTLRLNNELVDVAGVLPESFTGPAGLYSPDVWLPLDELRHFRTSPALARRDHRWLFLLGRMQTGVTAAEIQGRIQPAVAEMAGEWADTHRDRRAEFRMLGEGNSELRGLSAAAATAMGIIGLVLLLSCFNVANLLLARAVERERDMAVRAAIGAGTWRLVRLALTEGFLIAALAGAAALVVAAWTQSLVGSFAIPIEEPQHINLSPDFRVAGFVAALVIVAGVLPGLWPALAAARVDVLRVLGSHGAGAVGGRPSPLRRWLVTAQIAGSTTFLAVAALFAQSYDILSVADMGFARDRLVVAQFEPASHGYDVDRSSRYTDLLLARVRALPGIVDAAVADRAPFFVGFDHRTRVVAGGASCEGDRCPQHATLAVGPGYFKTMGIALAAGREFEEKNPAAEVIINQPLARAHWPDGRGIGETLRIGDTGTAVTVIGISAKTHTRGLDREQPTLYVPLSRQQFEGGLTLVARTAVPPESLVRTVADTAQALDPNVAMQAVKTMEQRMAVQLWPFRTVSRLFSICGGLALLLAVVGLAGVTMHAVNRRRKEFGLRVSIGATQRDLVTDVLKSSGKLLVPGLAVGTLLAAALARLTQAAFVGVNVLNPLTYLAVALLQSAIVAIACVKPALRAARVDPVAALRSE
jgi:predicted permease